MVKAFSIRTPLQGELFDFVKLSGFDSRPLTELVRDLTCLLASYREEGMLLYPDVFIFPSVDLIALISPGMERVVISDGALDDSAERILKDCANLAVRGWAIYVAMTDENKAEYGVFRSSLHSYATSAEESMAETSSASPVILIRNRGKLIVELRNAKGNSFIASFTSAPASESTPENHIITFASAVIEMLNEENRKRFEPYLVRLLTEALQNCHGTLLAAYEPPTDGQAPALLKDGVWLQKPIDLASAHHAAIDSKDANSLATLQAYEALLCGMIGSDGVVVFGTNGTLLGYRVFLKPTDEEKKDLPEKGGGRRRTYTLMQNRLGLKLKATLFRSQDGNIESQKVIR